MARLTLTVEEAAELLGIGRNTAYQAARTGELPTIKIGRRLMVPRTALERMLDLDNRRGGQVEIVQVGRKAPVAT